MSDTQLWLVAFFILISLIIFLNFRSDIFAEEVRKQRIINDLPLKKRDIDKLFRQKKPTRTQKKYGGHYRGIDFDSFNEFSPLKIMGYAVGNSGLNRRDREQILQLAIFGNFHRYMPSEIDYDRNWGGPGSKERFGSVYTHIRRVKDLRTGRPNMGTAVADWNTDLTWIGEQKSAVHKFRLFKEV